MSLQSIKGEIVQENYGFVFAMRVPGSSKTVRVVVANEALEIEDPTAADEELQAEFEQQVSYFEYVANEKYDQGRIAPDGVILITAGDLVNLLN